jgi:hypothetical protein
LLEERASCARLEGLILRSAHLARVSKEELASQDEVFETLRIGG